MDDNAPTLELVDRAKSGDKDALNELLRLLEPSVVRAVRLIVGSGLSIAEDAAQEAMLDVARSIGSLRDPAAVRVWAARIATRRAIKMARRERLFGLVRFPRPPDGPTAELQKPSSAALKDAFDELPPRLRATAVLRLYLGFSEAESAEALGVLRRHREVELARCSSTPG